MQCIDVQYIVLILAWMFFNNVPEIRLWQACFWRNYWMIGRETRMSWPYSLGLLILYLQIHAACEL